MSEKKLRYIEFVSKYLSRKPHDDFSHNPNPSTTQQNFISEDELYTNQDLGFNDRSFPTKPHKEILDNLAKDFLTIPNNEEELLDIWDFLLTTTENFDRDLFNGYHYQDDREKMVYVMNNHMVGNSCRYLERMLLKSIKSQCSRGKFPFVNSLQWGDNINMIYGYIEECVLNTNFLQQWPVKKDENEVPIWAVLYYCVTFFFYKGVGQDRRDRIG